MQLTRPFDIFSILVIALNPLQLTEQQRRLLQLFKMKTNRAFTVAGGIFMLWILWQIYRVAPIAAAVSPLGSGWRLVGLLGAAFAFLASNLFLQVPLAVAQVLLTRDSEFATTEPYPVENVHQDFTMPGIKVNQILPVKIVDSADATPSEVKLNPEKQ
jgi:hypothetical protein